MIWQIFRIHLKIGAPAAGLQGCWECWGGRGGGEGRRILLVANYRPCNKILTLHVPASSPPPSAKGGSSSQKCEEPLFLKSSSPRCQPLVQPCWAMSSPHGDEEHDRSALSISAHICVCKAEYMWVQCYGGRRGL